MRKKIKTRPTQADVADRAGVTRSMVSYVLNDNNERSVAPETKKKILDAIRDLGYRPNDIARALRMREKSVLADRHIGIVLRGVDMFLRPYYTEILQGIHLAAYEKGYQIQFIHFYDELKNPILFNKLIHSEEICGLLLISTDQCLKSVEDRKLIDQIRSRIEQIVCIEWQMPGLSSVSFDRQAAAVQVTNYLLNKGYYDIAYIGESDQRVTGFKQAFIEHGEIDISGLYIDNAADMASGYSAVRKLHQNKAMPKAIFAGSDEVAVGILLYLQEQGINVPDDTAVISIDNIEISGYTHPQLTTLNVQKQAMGYRAVEMIVNRSAGQEKDALTLLLPTELVIRRSA